MSFQGKFGPFYCILCLHTILLHPFLIIFGKMSQLPYDLLVVFYTAQRKTQFLRSLRAFRWSLERTRLAARQRLAKIWRMMRLRLQTNFNFARNSFKILIFENSSYILSYILFQFLSWPLFRVFERPMRCLR